eukprot:scaffold81870_cov56-Phaeocystis_antarctica.AAC.3
MIAWVGGRVEGWVEGWKGVWKVMEGRMHGGADGWKSGRVPGPAVACVGRAVSYHPYPSARWCRGIHPPPASHCALRPPRTCTCMHMRYDTCMCGAPAAARWACPCSGRAAAC